MRWKRSVAGTGPQCDKLLSQSRLMTRETRKVIRDPTFRDLPAEPIRSSDSTVRVSKRLCAEGAAPRLALSRTRQALTGQGPHRGRTAQSSHSLTTAARRTRSGIPGHASQGAQQQRIRMRLAYFQGARNCCDDCRGHAQRCSGIGRRRPNAALSVVGFDLTFDDLRPFGDQFR
jgi:hypothetical protein